MFLQFCENQVFPSRALDKSCTNPGLYTEGVAEVQHKIMRLFHVLASKKQLADKSSLLSH